MNTHKTSTATAAATALFLALTVAVTGWAATPEELIQQGDKYDASYDAEEALKYYLPAEQAQPQNASLLVKIARQYVYRMSDMPDKASQIASGRKALTYAERAVKLAPNECDSHLALAICWGKLTPLVGARESVEASRQIETAAKKAVKLNPQNDYAWHMLGRWHQALAQVGTLTRGIVKVIYGGLPEASNEEAVQCFEKAISLNSNRLIHYIELGRTYAQMGRGSEAKKEIEKGLAMPSKEKDDPESKARGKATLAQIKG